MFVVLFACCGLSALAVWYGKSPEERTATARAAALRLTPRATRTPSITKTPSKTPTATRTSTSTSTPTNTPTSTKTPTLDPSISPSATNTSTSTYTPTPTLGQVAALLVTRAARQTSTAIFVMSITATPIPTPKRNRANAIVKSPILNMRAGPGTGYAIVTQLQAGDFMELSGATPDGRWLLGHTSQYTGWISNDPTLITLYGDWSELRVVIIPPTAQASRPRNTPAPRSTSSGGGQSTPPPVTCPGFGYTCAQLTCPQAYACLAAGNGKLDSNSDGKPCETKCGG